MSKQHPTHDRTDDVPQQDVPQLKEAAETTTARTATRSRSPIPATGYGAAIVEMIKRRPDILNANLDDQPTLKSEEPPDPQVQEVPMS